ncbi:MAG: sulfite exporter TauE/SafE family protein [Actinomycetota bacterium]
MPEVLGLPVATFAACLAVVFAGSVMQATTGVGVGILSSPVLVLADPDFIPGATILAVIPLSLSVAVIERRDVDRGDAIATLAGRVPGMVLGVAVLAIISDQTLAILVGVTVLAGVAASLTTPRFHPTSAALAIAGFGSGFTGTAVGVGGPPIALVYQHADPVVMRATVSTIFSVGSVLSAIALAVGGEIGSRQLQLAGSLMPAVFVGLLVARYFREMLTGPAVRPAVLGLSAFAATALLVRTLT